MRPRMILEVRKSPKTGWFWRAKRANGRIVATAGERFTRKPDAIRAVQAFVNATAAAALITIRTGRQTLRLDIYDAGKLLGSFDALGLVGKGPAKSTAQRLDAAKREARKAR